MIKKIQIASIICLFVLINSNNYKQYELKNLIPDLTDLVQKEEVNLANTSSLTQKNLTKDTIFCTFIYMDSIHNIKINTQFKCKISGEGKIEKVNPKSIIQKCIFFENNTQIDTLFINQLKSGLTKEYSIPYNVNNVSIFTFKTENIYVFDCFIAQGEPVIQLYIDNKGAELFRVIIFNWMFSRYKILNKKISYNQALDCFKNFNYNNKNNYKIYNINGTDFLDYKYYDIF